MAAYAFVNFNIPLGVVGGLLVGLLIGCGNGILIAKVGINPFVTTLGMQVFVQGLLFVVTDAKPIYGLPSEFTFIGLGKIGPVPVATIIYAAVAVMVWVLLRFSRFGHYVYATGGNKEASRLAGVPVDRVMIGAYALGGSLAAVAGLVLLGQVNIGQPAMQAAWPLAAIAACVVGGTSLMGGVGTVPGVMVGTLLLGVVANALNLFGVSPYWQPAVTGVIILAAVGIDAVQRKRKGGIASIRNHRALRAGSTLGLTAILALSFSGATFAQDEEACPAPMGEPIEVGAMVWNTAVSFYSNFIKGQEDAAGCYGVNLDLQNGNGDLATEVAVIQQFIAQGKDAIIVTPSDVEGIVPVILQANEAGIPVFAANNRIGDAAEVVSFIGANDVEFGRRQGEMLVNAVGEEAKVGLILGALGTSAQILREQGLTEYLADHPGVEIIEKQTANWDGAEALALTQDWMSKYGEGEINAIVDQGPEGASAAQWAKQNDRSDVQFLLGDYPYDVKVAIEDGVVAGTVDQDPYPQGYDAVKYAYYWLTDQQDLVERPDHFLALPIVTADNVDEYPAAWGTPE